MVPESHDTDRAGLLLSRPDAGSLRTPPRLSSRIASPDILRPLVMRSRVEAIRVPRRSLPNRVPSTTFLLVLTHVNPLIWLLLVYCDLGDCR